MLAYTIQCDVCKKFFEEPSIDSVAVVRKKAQDKSWVVAIPQWAMHPGMTPETWGNAKSPRADICRPCMDKQVREQYYRAYQEMDRHRAEQEMNENSEGE